MYGFGSVRKPRAAAALLGLRDLMGAFASRPGEVHAEVVAPPPAPPGHSSAGTDDPYDPRTNRETA